MNLKALVAVGAFAVPIIMAIIVVVVLVMGADASVAAAIAGLAGNAFSWPGRVLASVLPAPKEPGDHS